MNRKLLIVVIGIAVCFAIGFGIKSYGNNPVNRIQPTVVSDNDGEDAVYDNIIVADTIPEKVSESDVALIGNDILITNEEIDNTETYYIAMGASEKTPGNLQSII